VASAAVAHLEYVLQDGVTSVYDMDHEFKLVKTITLPQTKAEVRGVTVAPSTHLMFIPYGGDGGGNGNGSVLAFDLITEKVVWDVKLNTGIDSGQVSPDGKRLYIPTGENTPSGIWNILNAANGALVGTIQGGSGAHNTVVSNNGRYVYLGGREYNYLDVYDTTNGTVRGIGPLVSTVRPFTVNGSNTLAFTTATEFDGFQVSSITGGKPLFTVSFGVVPKGFAFSGPSHGISLSPDEKQLYVIDSPNKKVRVYDVSRVAEGVAPTQLAAIAVAGLSGTETPCAYDCGRGGWLQRSVDGRLVYVGDSGEVIETATRKVLTTLPTLLNTKKSLEVDWSGGVPVATSNRTGVGEVP
jgi:WD40 repeat protein